MTRFECAEELKLITRLRSRMQKLERRREPSGRFVAALSGKQRSFSQTDCRQKQKCEPGAAADVTGHGRHQEPADTGDHENDGPSKAPAAKNSARPPRPRQNEQ